MPEFHYHHWQLFDAIDAVKAYDSGAVDSGVCDPGLKQAVIDYFGSLPSLDEIRLVSARYARRFLTDESVAKGYGIEDVIAFHNWLWSTG